MDPSHLNMPKYSSGLSITGKGTIPQTYTPKNILWLLQPHGIFKKDIYFPWRLVGPHIFHIPFTNQRSNENPLEPANQEPFITLLLAMWRCGLHPTARCVLLSWEERANKEILRKGPLSSGHHPGNFSNDFEAGIILNGDFLRKHP